MRVHGGTAMHYDGPIRLYNDHMLLGKLDSDTVHESTMYRSVRGMSDRSSQPGTRSIGTDTTHHNTNHMTNEKSSLHSFTIARFRDGDTVEGFLSCRCCGSARYETVRLAQIESWEINSDQKARALLTAQELSTRYRGTAGVLTPPNIRRDRYGRIIGDIIIEDSTLAVLLVTAGYAWWGVKEPEPPDHGSPFVS